MFSEVFGSRQARKLLGIQPLKAGRTCDTARGLLTWESCWIVEYVEPVQASTLLVVKGLHSVVVALLAFWHD